MRLRERLRDHRVRVGLGIAAAIAAYVLISRLFPDIDLQQLLEDVSDTLGGWTYLIVGGFAFLETGAFVGLVVPGETVMLLGGAVAGQGAINVYVLIGIAWFSAWAGDTVSFFLGRRLGRGFVLRRGPRFGLGPERFKQVEAYFSRHGGKTILIGRFIGIVRALAPFVAGSSGMRYRGFVPYSILGTGIWSTGHILIGYFASRSIEEAAEYAGRGVFLLGLTVAVIVGVVLAVRFLRVAENRRWAAAWMDRRWALRPVMALARRLRPPARFVWGRLTPGGTFGLEVTTVLAVLSVALFVLIAYTAILEGDPGPTPGDMTGIDVIRDLEVGWLSDLAKVLTELGSGYVVWPLAAVCALALALDRRWAEMWVLVAGMAVTIVCLYELKDAIDRPRPGDPLAESEGSSFPSGHAAYSTLYTWLAITLTMRIRPGLVGGGTIVLVGLALTVAVGLTRAYLRVHYLSDVSGGWALGFSAFALCTAVALLAIQLRKNARGAADDRP